MLVAVLVGFDQSGNNNVLDRLSLCSHHDPSQDVSSSPPACISIADVPELVPHF